MGASAWRGHRSRGLSSRLQTPHLAGVVHPALKNPVAMVPPSDPLQVHNDLTAGKFLQPKVLETITKLWSRTDSPAALHLYGIGASGEEPSRPILVGIARRKKGQGQVCVSAEEPCSRAWLRAGLG